MKIKTLTIDELRSKKSTEIEKYISGLKDDLAQLNHDFVTGKEKKTHQFNVIKKAIASANTILAEAKREDK